MADAPGTHRGSPLSSEQKALYQRAILANLRKGATQFGALELLPLGTEDDEGKIPPLPIIHYTTYHRWKAADEVFDAAVLAARADGSRRRMEIGTNAFIRNLQQTKPNATMAVFAVVNWSRQAARHGVDESELYENLQRGGVINIGGDGSALLPPKEIRIVTYDHDPAEDEPGADAAEEPSE